MKKAKPALKEKIEDANQRIKELTKASRDLVVRAQEIEDAAYDVKAVNPNTKPAGDTRTPAELLDLIEKTGRDVVKALETLRSL